MAEILLYFHLIYDVYVYVLDISSEAFYRGGDCCCI